MDRSGKMTSKIHQEWVPKWHDEDAAELKKPNVPLILWCANSLGTLLTSLIVHPYECHCLKSEEGLQLTTNKFVDHPKFSILRVLWLDSTSFLEKSVVEF